MWHICLSVNAAFCNCFCIQLNALVPSMDESENRVHSLWDWNGQLFLPLDFELRLWTWPLSLPTSQTTWTNAPQIVVHISHLACSHTDCKCEIWLPPLLPAGYFFLPFQLYFCAASSKQELCKDVILGQSSASVTRRLAVTGMVSLIIGQSMWAAILQWISTSTLIIVNSVECHRHLFNAVSLFTSFVVL